MALKRKVQSLINVGWLNLKKASEKSDVNNNPLPNHENSKVNVVDCIVEKCKNEVHEILRHMETLFEGFLEAGYVSSEYLDPNIRYEGYNESIHCIFHQGAAGHVIQQCCKFRYKVQLMDSKILIVYIGQEKDEMKYNKICALIGEVATKEKFFLPKPLTSLLSRSRNESTFCNPTTHNPSSESFQI